MTQPVLVRGLHKSFGKNHVLRGLDLEVAPGSIYGLLGRNGAGKSTLMRVMTGLVRPTSGTAHVMGRDPVTSAGWQKRDIAYVAQGEFLPPGARVGEVTDFEAALRPDWNPSSLTAWIREAGIERSRKLRELSGGERKRFELELAIASRAKLFFLDEPLAGLDPTARMDLMSQLMGFAAEHATTIIISSHIVGDLERLCDRVGILSRGAIGHESAVEDLKSRVGGTLEEITAELMRKLDAGEAVS